MSKDYEKKYENNKMSLHINNNGTVFDSDIPCVKSCFFFDPKHTLETVVSSVSNNLIDSFAILILFLFQQLQDEELRV